MDTGTEKDITLTPREEFILQAALSYTLSNLDDLNDAFEASDPDDAQESSLIETCGITGDPITEIEVAKMSWRLGIPVTD
jgi:hypothetical protein